MSANTSQASPSTAEKFDSDVVVILAAILCALICTVGLILVARYVWLRRITSRNTPTNILGHNKGLKKKILQSIPMLTFTPSLLRPSSCSECPICLTEFVEGDEIRILPVCSHVFHVNCIDTWLGSHSSCPSCRQILRAPFDPYTCKRCGASSDETMGNAREDDGNFGFLP